MLINNQNSFKNDRKTEIKNAKEQLTVPSKVIPKRHGFAPLRRKNKLVFRSKLHLLPLKITAHKSLVILQASLLRPGHGAFFSELKRSCFIGKPMEKPGRENNRPDGSNKCQKRHQKQHRRSPRHRPRSNVKKATASS